MELKEMQTRIWNNKVQKGFNITNVEREFCLLYGEVGEAYEAFIKKHDNFAEELADVAIYLMGVAQMAGIDLESQILRKIEINEKREYVMVNGVLVKKGSKDDVNSGE